MSSPSDLVEKAQHWAGAVITLSAFPIWGGINCFTHLNEDNQDITQSPNIVIMGWSLFKLISEMNKYAGMNEAAKIVADNLSVDALKECEDMLNFRIYLLLLGAWGFINNAIAHANKHNKGSIRSLQWQLPAGIAGAYYGYLQFRRADGIAQVFANK